MIGRNGFTLIELLVVIAIIAILAAILFPVFARARDKAMQSSCSSNLKQIGLAVQMYVQDYDEQLPIATIGGINGTPPTHDYGCCNGPVWNGNKDGSAEQQAPRGVDTGYVHWRLMPYMKNWEIWRCPSMRPVDAENSDEVSYLSSFAVRNLTGTAYSPLSGAALAEIEKPSSIPLFQDAVTWNGGGANLARVSLADARTPHGDGLNAPMNVQFADGHVKSLPVSAWHKALADVQPWR